MTPQDLQPYLSQISLPKSGSHKGQNGKVMVIGGSELFHAASQWALTVVSRMVDMVFYSSIPSNNQLVQDAKANFSNGIVIGREELENYIEEADVVLIGPGMERVKISDSSFQIPESLSPEEWNKDTQKIVNYLLSKYPHKKWVIDAGALQMVDPSLLNEKVIVTPHKKEFEDLMQKAARHWFTKYGEKTSKANNEMSVTVYMEQGSSWQIGVKDFEEIHDDWLWNEKRHQGWLARFLQEKEQGFTDAIWAEGKVSGDFKDASAALFGATILRKGEVDEVGRTKMEKRGKYKFELIPGGNVGMTKGGTGDVLAGLVAGLYCFTADPFAAAVVGSYLNKKAGDELFTSVGPFFNASDLANQLPRTLAEVFQYT